MTIKGYVHTKESWIDDEAILVENVKVVKKSNIIQPYDEYLGFMEMNDGNYAVFNTTDGSLKAYKYDE